MEFLICEAVIPRKAFSRKSWYMAVSTKAFCVKQNPLGRIFFFLLSRSKVFGKKYYKYYVFFGPHIHSEIQRQKNLFFPRTVFAHLKLDFFSHGDCTIFGFFWVFKVPKFTPTNFTLTNDIQNRCLKSSTSGTEEALAEKHWISGSSQLLCLINVLLSLIHYFL